MTTQMNQLQAVTFGLFLALTAKSDAKSEAAMAEVVQIADGLHENELEFAKSVADTLASAVQNCYFGITQNGTVAPFFTLPELNAFLKRTFGARVATSDEAFTYAANKAQAAVFHPA